MQPAALKKHLFLIGYRCTGKSSVARRLARQLNCPVADSDAEVVRQSGRSIDSIVAADGWEQFRHLERLALATLCSRSPRIIATGGGVVLDQRNVAAMRASGTLIWLKADAATIRSRLTADEQSRSLRPPLSGVDAADEIEQVLKFRRPLYEAAMDYALATDGKSIVELADIIVSIILEA